MKPFKTVIGRMTLMAFLFPQPQIYYTIPPIDTSYKLQAEVTAYTPSIDETDDTPNIMASGTTTKEGLIACPDNLKFGTEVIIEGYLYECQDRMNKRYRNLNHFDILMSSKEKAINFGRQKLTITIFPQK